MAAWFPAAIIVVIYFTFINIDVKTSFDCVKLALALKKIAHRTGRALSRQLLLQNGDKRVAI
jgi:hypothetical protein